MANAGRPKDPEEFINVKAEPAGRSGFRAPNLLALPRADAVRGCIVPPPGYVFITADYSAIEIRVLSAITGDPALQSVFDLGRAPHRTTASVIEATSRFIPEVRIEAEAAWKHTWVGER